MRLPKAAWLLRASRKPSELRKSTQEEEAALLWPSTGQGDVVSHWWYFTALPLYLCPTYSTPRTQTHRKVPCLALQVSETFQDIGSDSKIRKFNKSSAIALPEFDTENKAKGECTVTKGSEQ